MSPHMISAQLSFLKENTEVSHPAQVDRYSVQKMLDCVGIFQLFDFTAFYNDSGSVLTKKFVLLTA